MNSGSSAPISSASHAGPTLAARSWYQWSRPSTQSMSPPVRLITITERTSGHWATAPSVLALSGIARPPRSPSSEVTTTSQRASRMRPASESGEKPPNTIEWTAPMRAQASMAKASSGIIAR